MRTCERGLGLRSRRPHSVWRRVIVSFRRAHLLRVVVLPGRQDADIACQASLFGSPRLSHLHDAGNRTIANGKS